MKLKELIEKAQGNRSQNEYALHSGVSTGMIGKIKNGKRHPGPWTLKKLADKAYNGVTHDDLMIAAGYLPEVSETETIKEVLSPKMQEAIDLVKQFDESNLTTVIAMLESAKSMQEQYKKDTVNDN